VETAEGLRRILLLGDGLWAAAALRHLASRGRVLAVVERRTPTDASLAAAARAAGLPVHRLDDVNASDSLAWIHSLDPDLLLSVSYDQIFGSALLDDTRPPVLNVHAGHPGRHRGRAILCWQLLEGARAVDLSVMRVTRGIDAGPLLALDRVALEADDDYGAALGKVAEAVPALLEAAFAVLATGAAPADDARDGGSSGGPVYYPRRLPGDEWIDWSWPSERVLRLVRALAPPNPMARTRRGEEDLLVRRAAPCPGFPLSAGIPGAVIGRDPRRGALVRTGDGAVWLEELRDAAGRPLPPRALRLSERLGGDRPAELEGLCRRVRLLEDRLAALEAGVALEATP
jgi:methionyl-tRNA formyltransferase